MVKHRALKSLKICKSVIEAYSLMISRPQCSIARSDQTSGDPRGRPRATN